MTHINLDNNATTSLHPEVAATMVEAFHRYPGNPSSQHQLGQQARSALETIREETASILGLRTAGTNGDRLIFTSGCTEANNLVLQGTRRPGQTLISAIEHPSCTEVAEFLRGQGMPVRQLPVDAQGRLLIDALADALTCQTRLVSVMLANNETGVLQPLAKIVATCRSEGALLHSDATQAVGKIQVNFAELAIDAMSFSAHKFHGPTGVGGLVLRRDFPLEPLHRGGSQQAGLRAGTECIALAAGLLKALQLWQAAAVERQNHMRSLRDQLEDSLLCAEPDLSIHSRGADRLPNTSSISFPGVNRQAFVMALDLIGIAASTGSACESGSSEPSTVLHAMGLDAGQIESAIRFSVSALTTSSEITQSTHSILHAYRDLRRIEERLKTPLSSRISVQQRL
jgi:cysteine desulfurase